MYINVNALLQEEDRLRRLCDEKCAKVISEGRCAQKSASQSSAGDAKTASEASCNGSPTFQRQTSSRATVGDPTSANVDASGSV